MTFMPPLIIKQKADNFGSGQYKLTSRQTIANEDLQDYLMLTHFSETKWRLRIDSRSFKID